MIFGGVRMGTLLSRVCTACMHSSLSITKHRSDQKGRMLYFLFIPGRLGAEFWILKLEKLGWQALGGDYDKKPVGEGMAT